VSMMGAGLRPSGKPLDWPPYPKMQSAPHFYPDQIGLVSALTWAVIAGDRFMPRMFLDDLSYTPLAHYAAGTLVLLSVLALLLIWVRLTSVLDLWVMVAICMLMTEMTLVTFGMTTRFSLGWYVSRALAVVVSIVVLIALLAESMRLYVTLSRSRDQLRALNAELDHRVKNVRATVNAIITQTMEASSSHMDFVNALNRRIDSLARTHELLSKNNWRGALLAEIVQRELAPYTTGNTGASGAGVILKAEATQAVASVLHELTTNAAKYGAFSKLTGRVSVQWRWLQNGSQDRLAIEWRETGGPPVLAPSRSGYGTSIIRELIPFELGGTVDLAFASSGLQCQMEIPADWVRRTPRTRNGSLPTRA
jgi:two-component sensor histidine kinase